MKIKFHTPLRIALGGRDVKDYAVDQVVENPHPDLLAFESHWAPVDPAAQEQEDKEREILSLQEQIPSLEAQLIAQKSRLAFLQDEDTSELDQGEEEEVEVVEEGTKDDPVPARKKRK